MTKSQKWLMLNLKREELRRRRLDLGGHSGGRGHSGTGHSGESVTEAGDATNSFLEYDWSAPSESYYEIHDPHHDKKGDQIQLCIKLDREFLWVLVGLSLLYFFSQFSKKDFLKKLLTDIVLRRRRSIDDINIGTQFRFVERYDGKKGALLGNGLDFTVGHPCHCQACLNYISTNFDSRACRLLTKL